MHNNTSATPITGVMCFTLPPDVPEPKFKLFDRVHSVSKEIQGTIVGLEYIDFLVAVAKSYGDYGWSYTINTVWGGSREKILKRVDYCDESCWESDLTEVEQCAL